jgi:hypothetical protein
MKCQHWMLLGLVSLGATACLKTTDSTKKEAGITEEVAPALAPLTEVRIEILGPQASYGAVDPMVFSVDARPVAEDALSQLPESATVSRELQAAKIEWTHGMLETSTKILERRPSSQVAVARAQARDQIQRFYESLQVVERGVSGACPWVVKLRFVRSDQTVEERVGCQGEHSIGKETSRFIASYFRATPSGTPGVLLAEPRSASEL